MLEQMQKHMKWMLGIILAAVIVTFLFFGVYPSSSTGRTVAKVDGDVISYEEWNRSYLNLAENYRQIFKEKFNSGMEKMVRNQALQELIRNRLLSKEADRMGIRISDEELRQSILSIPAFSPNGAFDKRTYEYYLNRVNMTPAVFEASQREYLKRQRLVDIIQDSVTVTDAEVSAAMAAQPKKGAPPKDILRQQLVGKKRQDAEMAFIEGLKKKAKIKINESYAQM